MNIPKEINIKSPKIWNKEETTDDKVSNFVLSTAAKTGYPNRIAGYDSSNKGDSKTSI